MDESTGSLNLPEALLLADSMLDQCLARARDVISKAPPEAEPVAVVFKYFWSELGKEPQVLTFLAAHLATRLIKAEAQPTPEC